MVKRFLATLAIATLLFSVTISNFNFIVYAAEDIEDEKRDERKEYKDEKTREREEYHDNKQEERKEYRTEKSDERTEYKEEKRIEPVKCQEKTIVKSDDGSNLVMLARCLDDVNKQQYPDEEKKRA